MTVRCEIAEPDGLAPPSAAVPFPLRLGRRQSPTVQRRSEERACRPKAGRSSVSAIAADVFMNDEESQGLRTTRIIGTASFTCQ